MGDFTLSTNGSATSTPPQPPIESGFIPQILAHAQQFANQLPGLNFRPVNKVLKAAATASAILLAGIGLRVLGSSLCWGVFGYGLGLFAGILVINLTFDYNNGLLNSKLQLNDLQKRYAVPRTAALFLAMTIGIYKPIIGFSLAGTVAFVRGLTIQGDQAGSLRGNMPDENPSVVS